MLLLEQLHGPRRAHALDALDDLELADEAQERRNGPIAAVVGRVDVRSLEEAERGVCRCEGNALNIELN